MVAGPSLPHHWLAAQSGFRIAALSFLGGALGALGLDPFAFAPASVIALVFACALFLSAHSTKRAALVGWAFGFGWFAVALHWIVEPFLVDIARHGWMAPFALVFLSAGLALLWGAAFGLSQQFRSGVVQSLLLLCIIWTGIEALRGVLFTGFPWAMLGHALIGTPYIHLATLAGALGLTLALLTTSALIYLSLFQMRLMIAPALACLALPLFLVPADLAEEPDRPIIRLIQPNALQHQKWDPEFIPIFYQRQLEFTRALPVVDLVVWPETAIPYTLERAGGLITQINDAANGAGVILGAQRVEGPEYFNALAVIGPSGAVSSVYDKHHLVPFGEYIPLASVFSRIGFLGAAARATGGYSAGPGPEVLDIGPLGKALPLICYEGVFPRNLKTAQRPDWLLLLTNDAWFGTFSGPYQHLAQAQLRAVEQGLPMVRVANTGISAMIDPQGRIIDSIALGEAGYLDVALPRSLPPTLYARTGDGPALLLLIFLAITLLTLAGRLPVDANKPDA